MEKDFGGSLRENRRKYSKGEDDKLDAYIVPLLFWTVSEETTAITTTYITLALSMNLRDACCRDFEFGNLPLRVLPAVLLGGSSARFD